jgi:5-methylcytosine-specific restriction endonuclease McrA
MSCAEELQQIARDLRKESRYFKEWNINVLQAFIRDEGCCVYCAKPLLNTYGVASTGDHLLPKCIYPDLGG